MLPVSAGQVLNHFVDAWIELREPEFAVAIRFGGLVLLDPLVVGDLATAGDLRLERPVVFVQVELDVFLPWLTAVLGTIGIEIMELHAMNRTIDVVEEGIYQGIQEALSGKTIPLEEMWKGIDVE